MMAESPSKRTRIFSVFALALTLLLVVPTKAQTRDITMAFCGGRLRIQVPLDSKVRRYSGRNYQDYTITNSTFPPDQATLVVALTSDPHIGPVISDKTEPTEVLGTKSLWYVWTEEKQSARVFHRELMVTVNSPRSQCSRVHLFIAVKGSGEEQVQRMSELIQRISFEPQSK